MKLLKSFLITLLVLCAFNCKAKEDTTKQKALLTYIATCTGGSLTTCQSSCAESCGITADAALTNTSYPCISSCQSSCSTNCNSLGLLFTFLR